MKYADIKQDYINIIKKLKIDEPLIETLIDFVNTYDGKSEAEFHIFMVHLMEFLAYFKRIKIKAQGYEKIVETKVDYAEKLQQIKDEYELFEKTDGQTVPVAISN